MASDYSDMDEVALKELLEKADDYETRSKIRAAIRELKKKSGQGIRRQTGSSQYRRPGFQAPRLVTIPNSVTGNVLPSRVADGKSVKPPDKNTPVISYLNSKSEKSPVRKSSKDASPSHTYASQLPQSQPEDNWWRKSHGSSMSTTPTETPEPRGTEDRRSSERHLSDSQPEETFEPPPPRERSPTPEPKEPTPEPPKPRTPTPEPPKEPTPTPEPPKEPTPSPEPRREPTPSPEPPKEPTPSPEPPKEPTPSPEPEKEPTPSPEPEKEPTPSPEPPKEVTPSPEPIEEKIPSPEPVALVEQTPSPPVEYLQERSLSPEEEDDSRYYNRGKYEKDEEEYYDEDDDEDEELRRLEERESESGRKGSGNIAVVPDVLAQTEPGMEEDKDFRKKLRHTEDSNINTAAAFPTRRAAPEQVDFRNLLRKSTGPEKKDFKSGSKAQLDFRTNLKPKDEREKKEGNVETPPPPTKVEVDTKEPKNENVVNEPKPKSPVQTETRVDKDEEKREEKKELTKETLDDPYEARREARRREREERRKQLDEIRQEEKPSTDSKPVENGTEEDSYEARREARRRAREERHKKALDETSEPRLTYRERKQKEEAKRREEMKANKQKWAEMDQANNGENAGKSPLARQKSSGAQRGPQQLLAWCQHKTRYYENVEVKDFSNSWANGLALCAILHSFLPDVIPYDDLSPDNPRKNYTIALQAAEDVGLGHFFDVDDIIAAGSPDPKSMMTFLATIYTHFK